MRHFLNLYIPYNKIYQPEGVYMSYQPLKNEQDYGPDNLDEVPGIFSKMEPIEGAIEAFHEISKHYDCYILSTGPWDNPSSWTDKLLWVKKYLPEVAYKRLILSHHKNLNKGEDHG